MRTVIGVLTGGTTAAVWGIVRTSTISTTTLTTITNGIKDNFVAEKFFGDIIATIPRGTGTIVTTALIPNNTLLSRSDVIIKEIRENVTIVNNNS